jgi:hypothetical protein
MQLMFEGPGRSIAQALRRFCTEDMSMADPLDKAVSQAPATLGEGYLSRNDHGAVESVICSTGILLLLNTMPFSAAIIRVRASLYFKSWRRL